jgi:hypothetical protein
MILRVLFTGEVLCRRGAPLLRLALYASSYMRESIMMVVIIIPSFFSTSRLSLRSEPMSLNFQHVSRWQHVVTAYYTGWLLILEIGFLRSGCMFQRLMVFHSSTIATNAALYEPRGGKVADIVY